MSAFETFTTLLGSNAIASSTAAQPGELSAPVSRGQVTSNEDATGLQRHTLTTGDKAGLTDRAPASRLLPAPYWNPPQFSVGSTALLAAIGNDGHNLTCLGVELNQANQAPEKADPLLDDSRYIPGDKALLIAGGEVRQVNGVITVLSGKCTVTISPGGSVTVEADEVEVKGNLTVTGSTQLSGPASVNGKAIAVLGATDSANHSIVSSGQ